MYYFFDSIQFPFFNAHINPSPSLNFTLEQHQRQLRASILSFVFHKFRHWCVNATSITPAASYRRRYVIVSFFFLSPYIDTGGRADDNFFMLAKKISSRLLRWHNIFIICIFFFTYTRLLLLLRKIKDHAKAHLTKSSLAGNLLS